MSFPSNDIITLLKLSWNTMDLTEKTFFEQNSGNVGYIGIPWTYILEKNYNLQIVFNLLKSYINPQKQYFTCCQSIEFRKLFDLFKALNITNVYTPHKLISENKINEIHIKPCPIYTRLETIIESVPVYELIDNINCSRFWECLGLGIMPLLKNDVYELPIHELWKDSILYMKNIPGDDITKYIDAMGSNKVSIYKNNCIQLYNYYKTNYINKKPKNMVIFSNCHGERYIEMFKRDTNIAHMFNINYIVSYQQLTNFELYRDAFCTADILIINNIKKYEDYTVKNLKPLLKRGCLLIIIPFVRFEGYWLPEQYKQLKYVGGNAVSYFPNIDLADIDTHLNTKINKKVILAHFETSLKKLKQIEDEADIPFYDFFVKNHTRYPFFRDNYHPTMNMLEHIGKEIILKIRAKFDILYNQPEVCMKCDIKEYGHYKPIINSVKTALNIEYDLDTVFIVNRNIFLENILENELRGIPIKDLDEMKRLFPL